MYKYSMPFWDRKITLLHAASLTLGNTVSRSENLMESYTADSNPKVLGNHSCGANKGI